MNRVRNSQASRGPTASSGTDRETSSYRDVRLSDQRFPDDYASSIDEETADEVYLSVNATQKTPRSTMQLYCGPSSNFAFLQQVYKTFAQVDSLKSNAPSTTVTDQGIDYFKQREMFFGTSQSSVSSKGMEETEQSPLLTLELAHFFLERFSATVLHLVPFLNHKIMDQWLRQLYDAEDKEKAGDTRAIILAVLANGATLTKHVKWAEILYERAKREASLLEETVNNKAVQVSLLLISRPALVQRLS